MQPRYAPEEHEDKIYKLWQKHDAFNPDHYKGKKSGQTKPFSIIMPPPNANDPLHIGHAMFVALEDTLTRFHRMRGDDTLWLPGTDHAGIETQFVFEKKLQKQGKSRFQFDRDALYNMIWEYVQENSDTAVDQIKKLGASCDWSRFKFMLDEDVVRLTKETFAKMQKDGLIYRDIRLVNYCTKCGTSYSELEIQSVEQTTNLYYLRYPLFETPDEHIVVATTRPEPIFADTHLAVHPKDKKHQHLIGTQVINPLTKQPMTIIADEFVDPKFGTGVVKLTPAHDANDFAVAQKHKLPMNIAITREGKLTALAGKYAGLKVATAREQIIADLDKQGLIEKIDIAYKNTIKTCYKCARIIEPLPLPQFFVAVNKPGKSLTEAVLQTLAKKETKIYGAGREKILKHWLTNLNDWNISRQIVWGIRIPVWYQIDGHEDAISASFLNTAGEYTSGTLTELLKKHSLKTIAKGLQSLSADAEVPYIVGDSTPANRHEYLPETDTFDTWFSSAQWPVNTLKTTNKGDFARFYPTTVMETGYDILPFWVMRMMLLGIYLTNKSPFSEVYLHGLVRDEHGKKMSKSKGNVVNPLDMVSKYGADAVRMSLIIRSTPGIDKSVGERDFIAMRNLTNKIWNATRYVSMQEITDTSALPGDTVVSKKVATLSKDIAKLLEKRKIGVAADNTYGAFWHWFCDECIESHKQTTISLACLRKTLETFLQLLHPYMPFVTEACWQELHPESLLIEHAWPT
ncbi:MAG: valine--tRNA ligase [Candidatus Pacebacteria bacterium]|nr:valine--tRNA ligase [Candidatus Paceibacterota bacterium]PIR60316.1 MAG: valine--tRNA ligase [Candidatus Pacebacteria bacterium CG10_big_fil_rev_8_21_14_0_10_45_6]